MIEVQDKGLAPDAFEDAVQATAYIARVDVTHGELRLPPRVREHIADGDVVVHLVRGSDDIAVHTAQLTATSKLVGIEWPADVTAGTRVTVMCPRGSTSHDVGVLLPELERPLPGVEPEPAAEPVCTCTPEWCYVGDDVPDTALASECRRCAWLPEAESCLARIEADEAQLLAEPQSGESDEAWKPVTDDQLAAITGALRAVAEAAPVETTLPGPAEYTVPADLRPREDAPTETIPAVHAAEQVAEREDWPDEEPDAAETTTIIPAAGTLPPLKVAWSAFRRRLTPGRAVLLTAVVAVVITWAVAWAVMGR